jgi:hypothetical protein
MHMAQASELEAPRETPEAPEDAPEAAQVAEDPEGNVTVSLPEKPQRKERRAAAYSEAKAAAAAAEERAARLEREIAELRGHVMARPSAPQYQQQPAEDPHAREIGQIRNEQETIQAAIRSGSIQDGQQLERMRKRFYELDQRKDEVVEDRATRRALDQFRRQQSNQGGDYEETILRSEFPDVVSHQAAMGWARGTYYQMLAEGKPPTLQTSREALAKAAERFSLRQPSMPAPSPWRSAALRRGALAGGRSDVVERGPTRCLAEENGACPLAESRRARRLCAHGGADAKNGGQRRKRVGVDRRRLALFRSRRLAYR